MTSAPSKPSILYLDHSPVLGGAEHSLLQLLEHLDRGRWRTHLMSPEGELSRAARSLGIEVHVVAMPRLRQWVLGLPRWVRGIREMSGIVRQIPAALIHANTVRSAFYASAAARICRIPWIWHARDFWFQETRPDYPRIDYLLKRIVCASASRVIAVSGAVATCLPSSGKISVVHNGIDLHIFKPGSRGLEFRRRFGIPIRSPVVGMVGRLRPWKGVERFLRVMTLLSKSGSGTWCVIVGGSVFDPSSPYPESLRRQARSLGIEDRTVFTGHLSDVRPAIEAMDVFVHPGDPEPFGRVNIEAMALGKPVVAFAHGALPEIVLDGRTGLLVAPEDENGMSEAIGSLLQDPAGARRMGLAGMERVRDKFDHAETVEKTARIYEEVLERGL